VFPPTLLARAAHLACGCVAGWLMAQSAAAQSAAPLATPGTSAPAVSLKNAGPISIEADELTGLPDKAMAASGNVRVRRGPMSLGADQVQVESAQDQVRAAGHVQLERYGDRYTGSALELNTSEYTGFLLTPTYHLARTQAGGTASRINFLGPNKFAALDVTYSSCTVADADTLPWELSAKRLRADLDSNEGLAESAVLRFYGVPILAAPVMSFPVTDERKSGWLPLQLGGASNSGLEVAVPYYWNLAPNRDLTLTPTLSSRRGTGLQTELRYLEPNFRGEASTYLLPGDKVAGRDRWALRLNHEAQWQQQWFFDARVLKVSDDAYWNDGLRGATYLTPRLLPSTAQLLNQRLVQLGESVQATQTLYARAERYQALQGIDTTAPRLVAPYRREPQVGASWRGMDSVLDWRLETEVNRFSHEDSSKATGTRLHSRGHVAWPLGDGGWQLTPKVSFNAAAYDMNEAMSDGRRNAARFIPTTSLDSQWFLERPTQLFGRTLTQTLEPRLLYVHTPYRKQDTLPLFDSAGLDFNEFSIFADNAFSGVDRVSDAHQVTSGVTTRFLDRDSGAELARLGVAQRYLLRDQQLTPDGTPLTQSASDLLLSWALSAIPHWGFSGTAQYKPEDQRISRSTAGVVYQPGPYRVLSASYSFQRDTSEILTLGWQWPLWGPVRGESSSPAAQAVRDSAGSRTSSGARECRGTFYGVGRAEYSLREQRISNSILGVEYDAGCWIGRFVLQRTSTSLNTATTKWWLQLELVGLSRLGSNPLSTLRDNIPGYRLLNDRQSRNTATSSSLPSDGLDATRY
jgi:LPS-assembly protein